MPAAAGNPPNLGRGRRGHTFRRLMAVAAVLLLMAGSFAVGAFAVARGQAATEYLAMCGEVGDIQILLTGWLEKNSVNASNRVEGGVTVSFLDGDWKTTGTVTCDEEQSRIIREVLGAQDYDRESASFPCDLRIEFSGKEYFMNSSTGQIQPAEGDALGALLSAGDVRTILDQLK